MLESSTEQLQKKPVNSKPETLICILHVDDDADFLKCSKRILEMHNPFQIETALSVKKALQKLGQKSYDVIVADYKMPEASGLDLLKELRNGGNHIPFILFTGKGREEVAIKALNLGADQYINKIGKPEVIYSELAHAIGKVVKIKQAEKALQKSEENYRSLFENAPVVILTLDLKGNVTSINKVAEEYGFKKDKFIGKNMRKFVFKRYWPKLLKDLVQLSLGKTVKGKIEIDTPKGKKTAKYKSNPIIIDNKVIGVQAVLTDITEHKKAEEKLRESEEKFRNLAEKSPNMIFINKKGRVVYANKRCEEVMGYMREEFYSSDFNFFTLIAPESTKQLKSRYTRHLKGEEIRPYECTLITKEGKRIETILTSKLINYEGEKAILGIITDITERKKTEEKLKKSEEKYRSIVELSPDGIATMNMKGIITSVNKAFLDLTDFSEDEIIGKHFTKLGTIRARDLPKYIKLIGSIVRRKKLENFEFVYLRKDGTQRLGEARISLMKEKGKTVGLQAILRDITDRKKVEEALRRSEEKYRKQFEEAIDAIVLADAETGMIVDCNRAATKLVGRKKSELVGKHQRILHPPEEIKGEFSRTFKQHLKEREGQLLETHVITKTGEIRNVTIKANILELGDKKLLQGIFRDITEQKRSEESLRESEEKYRELLNGMNDTAWVIDLDGKFIDVNDAAVKVLGYTREELLSMGPKDLSTNLPEDEVQALIANMPKDEIQVFEAIHFTKDGRQIPVEISSSLVTYKGKQAILSIARDITERKKAREELRQSNERYRTVFENTGTAMCILEEDKTISMVNLRFEELSGYSWKELKGKKWTEFVTKEYLKRMERYHKARRKKSGKAPTHYSFDFVNKKGQIKNCMLTIELIPGTKKSVASILDITESKKAEKALREADKKYRKTILKANVGIIGYDPEGEVKILNPKMWQMTGFKRSEIPTLQDWFEKLYPNKEERHKIKDRWLKKMSEEGEVKEGQAIITTKDGKRRNFLFNAVRLETGDTIAFAEDITERKEAEEKLNKIMNELVAINEKLGVVGRLTRHDARNKLSVIANNVFLAKQKLPANHSSLEFLGDIESAIDQMEKIFDFARNYEMLGVEELSPMDVGKSVEEAAILLSGMNEVKLVNECRGLMVMADSLLRQLFYNLIDDTLKYGEKVSQIRVYHEEGEDQLKLVYEDDGVGIPESEKELIFKEGYGKGTGYGLYLIKKMCEEYGWTIRETGKQGKGVQFTIIIPKTNKNGKASYRFDTK